MPDGKTEATLQNHGATSIKAVAVPDLIPNDRNAKNHSAEQVAQIAASISEFGFNNPVLIDEKGELIAGHGRLMAAQKLGMETVPCVVLHHLTDAQRRAYAIADNRIAENGEWNTDLLALEIGDLSSLNVDLSLLGFTQGELISIQALSERGAGLADEDDAPPLPADPVTKSGDIWILGNHRVMCGDATDAEAVKRLLAGAEPHLMVTDPPYGVEYDPDWRIEYGWSREKSRGTVLNDHMANWGDAWALFPGDVAYIWHASLAFAGLAADLEANKFTMRTQIVWVKQDFVFSRSHYHWQHEPCLYAVRGKGHWNGGRKQTTVWNIANAGAFKGSGGDDMRTGHSTQKPVECMRRPIENNSEPGQQVYDPFLGSGTTVIAAEMTARACFGLEIDPGYCDVIVRRWQTYTGRRAHREDGSAFDAN